MKPVSVLYNNIGSAFENRHHMVVMGAFALCWRNVCSDDGGDVLIFVAELMRK